MYNCLQIHNTRTHTNPSFFLFDIPRFALIIVDFLYLVSYSRGEVFYPPTSTIQ